jgi:hypothetical protein
MEDFTAKKFDFILSATRKTGRERLHLLNRGAERSSYVACWNFNPSTGTWDWGTYSDTLMGALSAFVEKCDEHGFDDVSVGYVEMRDK